jgi:hypothetical protein
LVERDGAGFVYPAHVWLRFFVGVDLGHLWTCFVRAAFEIFLQFLEGLGVCFLAQIEVVSSLRVLE